MTIQRYSLTIRERAAALASAEGIPMSRDHNALWLADAKRVEELRREVNQNGLDWVPCADHGTNIDSVATKTGISHHCSECGEEVS